MSALGYRRHSIEISDGAAPSIQQLHDFIDLVASYPRGERVLLHCEGGCGRTGTFGAAWWIARGVSTAKATATVRAANRYAIETPGQKQVLEMFAREVSEIYNQAHDTFARLVALLYREVGVLDERNHSEIAAKRKMSSDFFPRRRKRISQELYLDTSAKRDPEAVLGAFKDRTGLSVRDVHRAFSEGEWRNSSGGYSYGGPKWARVGECVRCLCDALKAHDITRLKSLLEQVNNLEHNSGKVVEKFRQLDRP